MRSYRESDPYRLAGLQRNPFVEDGSAVHSELWLDRGWSMADVRSRVLVQFSGDRGAGKTSHLRRWQSQLGGTYRHVEPGWRRWRPPPVSAPVVFWDEADRIPVPLLATSLLSVATGGGMVVAGTHRDLGRHARKVGLEVVRISLDQITLEDVTEWANLRIRVAATDEDLARAVLGPVPARCARPTDSTTWRDIGDHLHRWAAAAVAEFANRR